MQTIPFRLAFAAVLLGVLPSCDSSLISDGLPDTGDMLETIEYGYSLPTTREGYAGFASIVTGQSLVLLDPGSGPTNPPRAVRRYQLPGLLIKDAQMDADGFLWVATPDRSLAGGILRYVYVIDPSEARVQRRILVPSELRSVAAILVGPDRIFLRSRRDGFSGAIGVVDRRCALNGDACRAEIFADLGNVGGAAMNGLRLMGERLYSFSNRNSRDNRRATDIVDTQTGEIILSSPISGGAAVNATSLYVEGYFEPGVFQIVRLDRQTLIETGRARFGHGGGRIAVADGRLYSSDSRDPTLFVYDADTFAPVQEIDVGEIERTSTGWISDALGPVAPGVLLLSHTSWLDTTTGTLHANEIPIESNGSSALRLPEGHPLAN